MLVVQSPVDREWFETLLVSEGFRVCICNAGLDALECWKQSSCSLILLDVDLDGHSGYEICKQIRMDTQNTGPYIPVILMTDENHGDARVEGFDSGADDVLIKPASPLDLIARIQNQMRIQQLQETLRDANQKLTETQQALEREMKKVGELQRSFLPTTLPTHTSFKVGGMYHPSAFAGGDYYDVIPLDESHWALVIADIAGHGVSAAVVMAMFQMALKEHASMEHSPMSMIRLLDQILRPYLQGHHFVTMFYGVLNLDSRSLVYGSAGHHPILWYRKQEQVIHEVDVEPAFPLCTFEMTDYPEGKITLDRGDALLLFTDGVLDVVNPEGDTFGLDRLKATVLESASGQGIDIVSSLWNATQAFSNNAEHSDDYTLLSVTVT